MKTLIVAGLAKTRRDMMALASILAMCYCSCSHKSPTPPPFNEPSQDYFPLATGNWWEYADTSRSFFSGFTTKKWGVERWKILSSSRRNDHIVYLVQIESSGKSMTTEHPEDTTNYATARQLEFVENGGRVTIDPTGTVLKRYMQPGERIPSVIVGCDTSLVLAGPPVQLDQRQISTLAVDYPRFRCPRGLGGTERLLVAGKIGIVARELTLGYTNTRFWQRLALRQYFIQTTERISE